MTDCYKNYARLMNDCWGREEYLAKFSLSNGTRYEMTTKGGVSG